MLRAGELVGGRYRILNCVGQGGQSRVYLAHDEKENRQWAIKELRRDIENYELARRALLTEIHLVAGLRHPCLPSMTDCIDEGPNGRLLIVMDYIEGKTLAEILKRYGAQPQERVVRWAKQLCDVLNFLHGRTPPIIYRDLKPSNIMLKPDGDIALIDFGTARQYRIADEEREDEGTADDTVCLGTRGYAAPEQFGGHGQTDARTDIYCLGATLYHLLTGRSPAKPPYEIRPIRTWNPALSAGLEETVAKCTMQDPRERYQSCGELRYALEHYKERDRGFRLSAAARLGTWAAAALVAVAAGVCSVSSAAEARELETIASFYDRMERPSEDMGEDESWLSYWSDLTSLAGGGFADGGGVETDLQIYDDVVRRIGENADLFVAAGVDKSELSATLKFIACRLEDDIIKPDSGDTPEYLSSKRVREMSLKLVEDLQTAQAAIGE